MKNLTPPQPPKVEGELPGLNNLSGLEEAIIRMHRGLNLSLKSEIVPKTRDPGLYKQLLEMELRAFEDFSKNTQG